MQNFKQIYLTRGKNVQHCPTMSITVRHAGSTPAARSASEPSTYNTSVGSNVGQLWHVDAEAAQNIIDFAAARQNGETAPEPEKKKEIATEAGHWYLPDGSPYYEVPYADARKGMRPVTLKDARKVNAYPSVTTVGKLLEKPALNNYKERHVFEATIRLLRGDREAAFKILDDFDEEALEQFFKEKVKPASQEHKEERAKVGTSLHGAIEQFLRGELLTEKFWLPHIANIVKATCQYGLDIRNGIPEHSFAHRFGFGGKVDYHERGATPLILDFKTKEELTDKQIAGKERIAYDEHAMQIAAYREGFDIPTARGINIFVGEKDRRVLIYEHTKSDLKRGWQMFQLLLRLWKMKNNYYPKGNNNTHD